MTDSGRRARGEDGAAIVEFTLVAVLLLTLVFGIIQFGLILSFKQDMTRAAAEGARAGAVALANDEAAVQAVALAATQEAVADFGGRFSTSTPSAAGQGCQVSHMSCTAVVIPCPEDASQRCVQVSLNYDYGDDPLFGRVPIIEAFLPDRVAATSIARINELLSP